MLVILYSRYTIPLNTEYSEVEEKVQVTGRIAGITDTSSGCKYDISNVNVIHGTHIKSYEHLLIYSYQNESDYNNSDFKIGNHIKASGKAKAFEHPGNPGQFDTYSYYRSRGYAYQIKPTNMEIINNNINRYAEFTRNISTRISNSFSQTLPQKDAGMMSAIVLGKKASLDADDKELYQDNGLMHLLAVSALHVSMISGVILWIVARLPISFVKGRIIVIIFLCIYGSIAGYGVSCLRAIIMIVCSIGANITGRTYDNLSALSLAGIITLLYNPTALFGVDYQLSYGSVIAINLTGRIIKRADISSKYLRMFINSFGISVGIAMFTLPVILANYYDVPLYSSFLNLLVIPVMPMLFVSAVISGCSGALADYIGQCIAGDAAIFIYIGNIGKCIGGIICGGLSGISGFMSGIVHYTLEFQRIIMQYSSKSAYQFRLTGCPETACIIAYYVIVCILIILLISINKNTLKTVCLLAGIMILSAVISFKPSDDKLKITTLDVGQGDGIFIEFPGDKNMFIDGGSSDVASLGRYRLQPYLYYKGVRSLDVWVITHGDNDHYSGFIEILDMVSAGKFHIREVWLADVRNPGDGYRMIEDRLGTLNIPVVRMSYGMEAEPGGCHITCLNPVRGMKSNGENEYSVVLLCEYKSFLALFTGDAEGAGEEQVTDYFKKMYYKSGRYPNGVSVLKVPHHGSGNSSSEQYVRMVHPSISIISCGKDNRYGHPAESTLERLNAVNSRIYDTVHSGAVTVISDGIQMWTEGFKN